MSRIRRYRLESFRRETKSSGLNTKLSDSWVGPCVIEKRNSPLCLRVNTGERVLQSVHVQLLKKHTPRPPDTSVKRVTTVLEPLIVWNSSMLRPT